MSPAFSRGEVVLTRFPFANLTGSSVRPALVVSQGLIGQDVILAAISSVLRGSSIATDLSVDHSQGEFGLTGLRVASVIRLHKVAAVHHGVVVRRLGRIGPQLQAEVDRLLRLALGL